MTREGIKVGKGPDSASRCHGSTHFLWEKLLHQALFVLLEGFDLFALRPDQIIQRGEAIGDFLLFGK